MVGEIYAALGLLKSGHVVETDRSGLVADYVGQTDGKTKKMIREALDGVLFIDEAYTLSPPHSQLEFGREAINALLVEMENNRDRLAVIVAGYGEEMATFINSNPGLRSRFGRFIDFPDYGASEMLSMFTLLAGDQDYVLDEQARRSLTRLFEDAESSRGKGFGNGRYVRNAFERVVELHSLRMSEKRHPTSIELSLITANDVPPKT